MAEGIKNAHKRLSRRLMGRPGVVGTAIGLAAGKPCIKVYVARDGDAAKANVPRSYDGYRVVVEKSGAIRRLSS